MFPHKQIKAKVKFLLACAIFFGSEIGNAHAAASCASGEETRTQDQYAIGELSNPSIFQTNGITVSNAQDKCPAHKHGQDLHLVQNNTEAAPLLDHPGSSQVTSTDDSKSLPERLVSAGNPPTLGAPDAPVTIVVFNDFECPFCRMFSQTLIEKVLPGEAKNVRIIYRSFPLDKHPWAMKAAEIATCVSDQNSHTFWGLSEFIFRNQKDITSDNVEAKLSEFSIAQNGIDGNELRDCIEHERSWTTVTQDIALGHDAGVTLTPTFFINGRKFVGAIDSETLQRRIADALATSQ